MKYFYRNNIKIRKNFKIFIFMQNLLKNYFQEDKIMKL